mmetsp:Transcript_127560/g.291543  ORF Transcript_127560/g.291543 Transcript_127560/m.291543 type:complete len:515 (-) Transcript_127560:6-1550(-)
MPQLGLRVLAYVASAGAVVRSQLDACKEAQPGDLCYYEDQSGVCSSRLNGDGLACTSDPALVVGDVNCARGIRSSIGLCCAPECEVCAAAQCTSGDVPAQCCESDRSCAEFSAPCMYESTSPSVPATPSGSGGQDTAGEEMGSDFLAWLASDGWQILAGMVGGLGGCGCCCVAVWWRKHRRKIRQPRRFVARVASGAKSRRPAPDPRPNKVTITVAKPRGQSAAAPPQPARAPPMKVFERFTARNRASRPPANAPSESSSGSLPPWRMPAGHSESEGAVSEGGGSIAFSHGLESDTESEGREKSKVAKAPKAARAPAAAEAPRAPKAGQVPAAKSGGGGPVATKAATDSKERPSAAAAKSRQASSFNPKARTAAKPAAPVARPAPPTPEPRPGKGPPGGGVVIMEAAPRRPQARVAKGKAPKGKATAAKGPSKARAGNVAAPRWHSSAPWKAKPEQDSDPESEPSSGAPSDANVVALRRFVDQMSNAASSAAGTSDAGDDLDDEFFGKRREIEQ